MEKHRGFQHELAERQVMYEATYKRGKTLAEHAPRAEQAGINLTNELLKQKWTELISAALQRQRSIEEALLACGQFDEALSSLREWLEKELPNLEDMENQPVHGDLETVSKLNDAHAELTAQIHGRRDTMNSVKERAQQMLKGKETDDSLDGLRKKLEKMDVDWEHLESLAKKRNERLKNALVDAKNFDEQIHDFV
ncbi:unnamed protein product [Gongylonema pulchrum]|uniref:Uncharacterized protein n=1 Tax=Gongylonema pulchrum TaxID=637853 RepID=A0A3P6RTL4_9BILA|nr:unnamed protein product [Gongylonema pulchrum]